MCKELAMVSKTETGRAIRRYFIEAEKELRGISQLPRESLLFKGLKAKNINGRHMYPYKEILRRCGYSTRSSSSSRKAKYWMHFVVADNMLYITEEYATHLHHSRLVYNNRRAMQSSKPVIPSLFGDNTFLPTLKPNA